MSQDPRLRPAPTRAATGSSSLGSRHVQSASAVSIGRWSRTDKSVGLRLLSLVLAVGVAASVLSTSAFGADRVDGTTPGKLKIAAEVLPDVSMRSGALVTEDGRVLWSRKTDEPFAMASLTKIMTAIVALENSDPTDMVTVPRSAKTIGESTSFLRTGEKLKMSELLEALLVKSGNDAAIAVAVHVAGSEKAFVKMMNQKADELGLSETNFANSHGLDEKGHRSSASDLGVLARYAMRNERFRAIVKKSSARIQHESGSQKIENTNLMLRNYKGANGVKTGWTDDAGYSVVASARRGDQELYAVVLGTPSERKRFAEATELLDWGFAHYREQKLASAGTVVGEAPVTDYLDTTVPGAFPKDESLAVFDLSGPIDRTVTMAAVRAPVQKGDRVGVASFTQRGRVVATVPLVATRSVEKPNLFERFGIGVVRLWRRFTGTAPEAAVSGSSSGQLVASAAVWY